MLEWLKRSTIGWTWREAGVFTSSYTERGNRYDPLPSCPASLPSLKSYWAFVLKFGRHFGCLTGPVSSCSEIEFGHDPKIPTTALVLSVEFGFRRMAIILRNKVATEVLFPT
jgi:hypothetical protein